MAGWTRENSQPVPSKNQHKDLDYVNFIQSDTVRDGSGGNHRFDTCVFDCSNVLPGYGTSNPGNGILRHAGAFGLRLDDADSLANADHFFDDIFDCSYAGDQTGNLPGR